VPYPLSRSDEALSRVVLCKAHDVFELWERLQGLVDDAAALICGETPECLPGRPSLVIIDSIGALLQPALGGRSAVQGTAMALQVGKMLLHVADALGVAVVVTNHTVPQRTRARDGGGMGEDRGSDRPALGDMWRSQVHVRVELSPPEPAPGSDAGNRLAKARVTQATVLEVGGEVTLLLSGAGVGHPA